MEWLTITVQEVPLRFVLSIHVAFGVHARTQPECDRYRMIGETRLEGPKASTDSWTFEKASIDKCGNRVSEKIMVEHKQKALFRKQFIHLTVIGPTELPFDR